MSKWITEWIISASVLILVVLVLRSALKHKLSPGLKYGLWLLVLVRLLVPVSFFEADFSVGNTAPVQYITEIQSQNKIVYVDYELPDLAVPEPDPQLPAKEQKEAYQQSLNAYQEALEIAKVTTGTPISLPGILCCIWAVGAAVTALILLICNLHFAGQLRLSRKPLELGTSLPVYQTDRVSTPCLFGLWKPAIYLPTEAVHSHSLNHILIHETTHYRHFDHIWSCLRCVCLAVHWFNPLVWAAVRLSRKDSELACDDATIRTLGEDQRLSYGKTLIEMTCVRTAFSELLLTATTMTGSRKTLKDRITTIARHPKTTLVTLIAILLILSVAAGCTFTGSRSTDTPRDSGFQYDMDADYLTPTGVPYDSHSPSGTLADPELLQEVTACFTGSSDDAYWYRQSLTGYFTSPETVHLLPLFYNGIPEADNTLTTGEINYLAQYETIAMDLNLDIFRIRISEMDRILQTYYGVSLGDTEGYGLGSFAYYAETGSLYLCHSDTNVAEISILDVYDDGDGTVRMYYTRSGTDDTCVARLKKSSSSWQFLSNVLCSNYQPPTEETEASEPAETTTATIPPVDISSDIPVSTHTVETLTWTDSVGNENDFFFRIPAIDPFSPDAEEAQQEILDEFLPILEENRQTAEDGYSNHLTRVDYTAEVCENILSLLIVTDTAYDASYYRVYNFDLETGKRLTPSQTAERFGLAPENYLPVLAEAAEQRFREMYGEDPEAFYDPEFYLQQLDATLQEENLSQSLVYITGYQLNAIIDIASIAGADSYWHILPILTKE